MPRLGDRLKTTDDEFGEFVAIIDATPEGEVYELLMDDGTTKYFPEGDVIEEDYEGSIPADDVEDIVQDVAAAGEVIKKAVFMEEDKVNIDGQSGTVKEVDDEGNVRVDYDSPSEGEQGTVLNEDADEYDRVERVAQVFRRIRAW